MGCQAPKLILPQKLVRIQSRSLLGSMLQEFLLSARESSAFAGSAGFYPVAAVELDTAATAGG
jgi:hypothetical protein